MHFILYSNWFKVPIIAFFFQAYFHFRCQRWKDMAQNLDRVFVSQCAQEAHLSVQYWNFYICNYSRLVYGWLDSCNTYSTQRRKNKNYIKFQYGSISDLIVEQTLKRSPSLPVKYLPRWYHGNIISSHLYEWYRQKKST